MTKPAPAPAERGKGGVPREGVRGRRAKWNDGLFPAQRREKGSHARGVF
jgi:hypothetical protein